jgi:uncharacterized protein YdhG (YjbR/CyaY superfamily)
MERKSNFKDINEYINNFPNEVQEKLQEIRKFIHNCVPEAKEAISWGMPTFKLNGNLIHFAAFKKHIGLYPGASPIIEFKKELANYKTSKGAIQLPLDKPTPFDLIKKIVEFRKKENSDL